MHLESIYLTPKTVNKPHFGTGIFLTSITRIDYYTYITYIICLVVILDDILLEEWAVSGGLVGGLVYPALLLIFMQTTKVKQAFQSREETGPN